MTHRSEKGDEMNCQKRTVSFLFSIMTLSACGGLDGTTSVDDGAFGEAGLETMEQALSRESAEGQRLAAASADIQFDADGFAHVEAHGIPAVEAPPGVEQWSAFGTVDVMRTTEKSFVGTLQIEGSDSDGRVISFGSYDVVVVDGVVERFEVFALNPDGTRMSTSAALTLLEGMTSSVNDAPLSWGCWWDAGMVVGHIAGAIIATGAALTACGSVVITNGVSIGICLAALGAQGYAYGLLIERLIEFACECIDSRYEFCPQDPS
jgi:hypothetical protein